jgi:hypothetical protein
MRLTGEDMHCVNNLEYLGVAVSKKSSSSGFSLSFGKRKVRRAVREIAGSGAGPSAPVHTPGASIRSAGLLATPRKSATS